MRCQSCNKQLTTAEEKQKGQCLMCRRIEVRMEELMTQGRRFPIKVS